MNTTLEARTEKSEGRIQLCAQSSHFALVSRRSGAPPDHTAALAAGLRAFTLIELLVVMGMVATLSLLLLPALAGAKADTWRAQCQNNLKQLGSALTLFEPDHGDMFPPAGFKTQQGPRAWDAYVHRYMGENGPESWWAQGIVPIEFSPKIERCPADTQTKVFWLGNPPFNGIRSYAMANWSRRTVGAFTESRTYPLPTIELGVGISWVDSIYGPAFNGDWDAKSYQVSVVNDFAGTILLVEEPNGGGAVGGNWPCVSLGPVATMSGSFGQLDLARPIQNPISGVGVNQGWNTYQAHGNRFNYLFHDNHVEALTIEQTIGTGTTNAPKGMWTVTTGD